MIDVVPALLLVVGLIALVKPGWIAAIDRRQKAAGTTRRPSDIEMTDAHYALIQIVGFGLTLFGFIFALRSL